MIERKFILEKMREFSVREYIRNTLKKAGISVVKLHKTPLGEKITITTSRPGLIVGRKGQNIRLLTQDLKNKFNLDNPQIEIDEVRNMNLDPRIVADKIANSLEKFGLARFKAIGHKALDGVMRSGARGVEILISGKIPSSRARTWRFYSGYMKKSGQFNKEGVLKAYATALLKTGIVGIKVSIMPADVDLPDAIGKVETVVEEIKEEPKEEKKTSKKSSAKRTSKKKAKESPAKDDAKKGARKAAKKASKQDDETKDSNEDTKDEDPKEDAPGKSKEEKETSVAEENKKVDESNGSSSEKEDGNEVVQDDIHKEDKKVAENETEGTEKSE